MPSLFAPNAYLMFITYYFGYIMYIMKTLSKLSFLKWEPISLFVFCPGSASSGTGYSLDIRGKTPESSRKCLFLLILAQVKSIT